jgi:hypothetical protein
LTISILVVKLDGITQFLWSSIRPVIAMRNCGYFDLPGNCAVLVVVDSTSYRNEELRLLSSGKNPDTKTYTATLSGSSDCTKLQVLDWHLTRSPWVLVFDSTIASPHVGHFSPVGLSHVAVLQAG